MSTKKSRGRRNEMVFNQIFGTHLCKAHPIWKPTIKIETTGLIKGNEYLQPDILVHDPDMPPVIIETSFLKNDADNDAKKRLGLIYKDTNTRIHTTIAIELDKKYRNRNSFTLDDMFKYALHQEVRGGGANANTDVSRRKGF